MTINTMNKLIIDNQTDLSEIEVFPYIWEIINQGKISNNNKQHCYVTTFKDGIVVCSFLNKKSERLLVYKDKWQERNNNEEN